MLGPDQPALLSVGDGGQRRHTRLAGQCPARPEQLGVAMRRRASPLGIRSRVATTSAGELPPNSVGEAFDGQRTHQPMLDAGRAAQIALHPAVQRQLLGIRQRIKGQPQSDTDEFVSRRS